MILQYHNGGVIMADTTPKRDGAFTKQVRAIIEDNLTLEDRYAALAPLVRECYHSDLYRFIQSNPGATSLCRWLEARR